MNVESLVWEFQKGNVEVFDTIYTQLKGERNIMISWLRKGMPTTISNHEIAAIFDDALLTSVEKYKEGSEASFITFLKGTIKLMKNSTLKHINRKKRKAEFGEISFDLESDGESINLNETVEDCSALEMFTNLLGSETFYLIDEYSSISDKKKMNALLLITYHSEHADTNVKFSELRRITGGNETEDALRKKCQRAKTDLLKYLQSRKIAV